MNTKLRDLVFTSARDLSTKTMGLMDDYLNDTPDDPLLRGTLARGILHMTTLHILKGMKHPDSNLKNIVREYCVDLYDLINDGEI